MRLFIVICRKRRNENSSLEAALKELANANAKNMKLAADLRRAQESILSLQMSLGSANNASEGVEFERENIGPHCSQRVGGETSMEMSRFMSSVNQISVSTINVPECKPATEGEEIGKFEFQAWLDLLKDTMKLAGVNDEETQFIVFKVKAGPKLLEIYRNTKSNADSPDPVAYPFNNAIHRLQTFFGSGSDIMLQRRKLALMIQKPDEPDLSFIMRVGAIARMCEFEEGKEFEEISNIVAEHARNREVRIAALKIFNRKGSLTDLVNKVREIQALNMNEEFYQLRQGKREEVTVAPVNAGMRGKRYDYSGGRVRFSNERFQRKANWGSLQPSVSGWRSSDERCYRCNNFNHKPSECIAINKTCLKCGRKGHFQRACKVFVRPPNNRQSNTENSNTASNEIDLIETAENIKNEKLNSNENVGN